MEKITLSYKFNHEESHSKDLNVQLESTTGFSRGEVVDAFYEFLKSAGFSVPEEES